MDRARTGLRKRVWRPASIVLSVGIQRAQEAPPRR